MDALTSSRGRPDLVAVVLVVAGAGAVAVTFAPWHHSGSAVRNSHELLASADRLGVLEGTMRRALATAWAVLPFVVAVAAVSIALGARRAAAGLALAAGALQLLLSIVVMGTGDSAGWGARAGAATGSLLMISAITLVATRRDTT